MNLTKDNYMLGMDLSNRKFGLDILRSLAIIFVVITHSNLSFLPDSIRLIINFFVFDGVNIFFVLSGFLIGTILIKTIDAADFKLKGLMRFWTNRWLRTLPPYYFILIITFCICRYFNFLVEETDLSSEIIFRYIFFLHNFESFQFFFFGESWSLAVEEWFYILIPVALFILYNIIKLNIKKSFFIVIILGISFSLVYRIYIYQTEYSEIIEEYIFMFNFRFPVLARLDGIMYGVLGAYICYFYNKIWSDKSRLCFIIGLILIIINQIVCCYYFHLKVINFYVCCYSFSIFSLSILLMMPHLLKIKPKNNSFFYRSMTFISLISYSLYLLNNTVIARIIMPVLEKHFNLSGFYHLIIFWMLSIVLSTLMFKIIEKPSMDLRKIIFKK